MGGTLSKADPSATVEVVGAGYSRTGTSSLQLALEKLINGPVYHGGTQIWLSGNDGMNWQSPGLLRMMLVAANK